MSDRLDRIAVVQIDDSGSEGAGEFRSVSTEKTSPEGLAQRINRTLQDSTVEFVCLVAGGGVLAPDGLQRLEEEMLETGADALYADDLFIENDAAIRRRRPDFSPERLRCQYYWGDLVVYRRAFLLGLGGLRFDDASVTLYDLALRTARAGARVHHIASPLLTVATDTSTNLSSSAMDSIRVVLEEHLEATGGGVVHSIGADGVHVTRRTVDGEPLVSIVIPTRGTHVIVEGERKCYLIDAIESILAVSTYSNLEFVIVVDAVAEPAVRDKLQASLGDRLVLVEWDKPFNFSGKVNLGVVHAAGEYVLILNDDVEVITPDWIEALLALAQLPGSGMAGAMLYYDDETIQHAGHAYWRGDASHIGLDLPRGHPGPLSGFQVEREVSGVTAACAMMPRSVYFDVGGLSELLPGAFNDVDLCMKTTMRDYSIYWTPHAELYHFESKSRDPMVRGFEVNITWGRWGHRMHDARFWPYELSRPAR